MVEAGANEVSEEVMVEALALGHQAIQPLVEVQLRMAQEVGKPKREVQRFLIDQDAAGHGWFIDQTPADDSEFAERLASLGDDLARARTDYLNTRHATDVLVGTDEEETPR